MAGEWIGMDEALARITGATARADAAARRVVSRSASVLEAGIKAGFEGAHRPGEPHVGGAEPNIVTGTLRRSITRTRVTRAGLGSWTASVGPTTVYGRRIELGYAGISRPFPYVAPAKDRVKAKLEKIGLEAWASLH